MRHKTKIVLLILLSILTIAFGVCGVLLFKYSFNFAEGSDRYAVTMAGMIFCFLLMLGGLGGLISILVGGFDEN